MWYKAAADRGAKTANAQLKNLSGLLTGDQAKQASEAAAKLTDTLPKLDLGSGATSVGGLLQGR
jgi:hypothetical protein